jgi:hypothetical protein
MPLVSKTWYGPAIAARVNKASGRAIVAIAENVAVETKQITHVISDTLRKSVHAAPKDYDGQGDQARAEATDLHGHPFSATDTPQGPTVEVGSWITYAWTEWITRGHPGVTQGLDLARGAADGIVEASFKAEGL